MNGIAHYLAREYLTHMATETEELDFPYICTDPTCGRLLTEEQGVAYQHGRPEPAQCPYCGGDTASADEWADEQATTVAIDRKATDEQGEQD